MAEIVRPALGQQVAIGTLYDARVDEFLSSSILPPNPPQGTVLRSSCQPSHQRQSGIHQGSSHASRFNAMRIDGNLAASILSGLIDLKGSANFLKDSTLDGDILYGVNRSFFNTYEDVLNLHQSVLRNGMASGIFLPADRRSTHVVTGIRWGLQSIMTMKHRIVDASQRAALEVAFQKDLGELDDIARSIYSVDCSDDSLSHRLKLDYEFMLYTDIQRDYGICKETLPVMCRFVQTGPQQILHTAGSAGYPIEYTLLPIYMLRHLMPDGGVVPSPHHPLRAVANIEPLFVLFDDWSACKEKVEGYRHSLVGREQYLSRSHIEEVDTALTRLEAFGKDLQMTLLRIILGIRDGTGDEILLQQLYNVHESSPGKISMIAGQQSDKLRFIEQCLNSGATYIGFNGACVNERTLSHDPPPYHFLFNNAVLKSSISWNELCTILREFLYNPQNQNQVFIVDCDAPSEYRELEAPIFGPIRTMPKPAIEVSEYRDMSAERRLPIRQAEHRQQPQSHWNSSDPDQELENRTIRVGSGDDEHDGTNGDSATQKTSVYRVTYNDTKYRIIDTPGIGDTRDPEIDNKNIKDIMNTLKRYEELHGILILVKTNEARLTPTIHFCFEELLSHLHRSAVANVVFGFTHTLISNYAPGDALGPLQSFLKGAREALGHLMIPMVEVSQEIRKNLSLLEEKMAELKDMRLTGDELRKRLHLERIKVVPTKLEKPRTVCKNKHCCEFRSNSNGEVVPFYRSICHEDCRLPGVTEECVGHPELIKCKAFKETKDKSCKSCKHSWQEHMHFFYELTESKVRVKDKDVERRLRNNASDVALRQEGIERVRQLEKEYRSEQRQLRKATAQFVAYLREHSANAFNDATEKYYDQLINIETGKIQFGKDNRINVDANKRKLKGLADDRDRHLELVKTIQENMHAPRDQTEALLTQDGVEQLIRDLYNLKHFGKSLRSLRDDITHYKDDGKRSRRSRSRRSRSTETREDVSDRSSRSDEREDSGRNSGILRGIHKFLFDM
ncbi:hypothetical protein H9Q72_001219 [Fusarium xylarioides]|uniref:AIG1-type G domain-containing protein n=1 Tax=Fusarium xylarioides TaxID=221167 RepID=A0A9P7I8Q3_9HYPO|nr:hypothetical protein H9Q72_001219 [Fusarium xylarioides]